MLIILCGPPFSGQAHITTYLRSKHQFMSIGLRPLQRSEENRCDVSLDTVAEIDSYILSDNHWQQNWVALGISLVQDVRVLRKRPYALVVAVDAPVEQRWANLGSNHPMTNTTDPTTLFKLLFPSPYHPQYFASVHPDMTVVLDTPDINLEKALDFCQFTNINRLRPNWDMYFIQLCHLASTRSNCMKRRVGCIVVSPSFRVLSTGYNGTPRNVLNCCHGGCARCNSGTSSAGANLDSCLCMHAEENALLEIGRHALGATMFCTTFPCLSCAKKIVQCGITQIVYDHAYSSASDHVVVSVLFSQVGIVPRQVCTTAPELPSLIVASQVI